MPPAGGTGTGIEPPHEPSDTVRESSEHLRMPFSAAHDSFFTPHEDSESAHEGNFRPHGMADVLHGAVEAAHG